MRRFLHVTLFLTFWIASCAPQPVRVAEPTSTPSPTALPDLHAPEIRFALISNSPAGQVNVWELFDKTGASYTEYALRGEYWPRLYHLAPPDLSFEPLAANGMPSEVKQEGDLYTGEVSLRTDLKWTDGSAFTAEDVAFTVNAALSFELGYDWSAYYPRDYLDRAEAVDPSTVKFYFKQKPNVAVWQYGALQGPVVQKAFWQKSVEESSALLPDAALRADIEKTLADLATVISDVAELTAQVTALRVSGKQNRILDSDLKRKQDEQIYVQSNLDKFLEDYASRVAAAQAALYQADDSGEPVLGTWIPEENKSDLWINKANPDFPFTHPSFDRASYQIFADEESARAAFESGKVDSILSSDGAVGNGLPDIKHSPTYEARFLVFNSSRTQFADRTLHTALACMLDRSFLAADVLQNHASPLDSFVLSPQWHDPAAKDLCAGMDEATRIAQSVKFLKDAGYSWTKEPSANGAGGDLFMSNGQAFPKITLLAPSKDEDPLRYAAAKYVAERAQYLGIPFAVQETTLNDLVYAVYSSQKYDVALMGWRLSEYPAYLCEVFSAQSLFMYTSGRPPVSLIDGVQPVCDSLKVESKLDAARQSIHQVEAALMTQLQLIPLFTVSRVDAYQNVSYPSDVVLNGWGGQYGAPSYAVPLP